ncbi:hypothetical protein [Streptomyces xanthophaeus]|uniref:hypothetical protein n=1 Tax=Streptomyces xanthophaeus TaxID=67385 RepID=UPI00099B405D|nr:hypothetical protein [Streptomyces xanthophaeus]
MSIEGSRTTAGTTGVGLVGGAGVWGAFLRPAVIRNFVAGSACSSPAVCSSRLCAGSGAVTCALVPWNSCGAFMGAVPGVPTPAYGPIAVFDYAGPGRGRTRARHRSVASSPATQGRRRRKP